jgi:hypothetical protein
VLCVVQSVKNAALQRMRVLQEMAAMLQVQHHPHAVKLLAAYEDAKGYQLILELLQGELEQQDQAGQGTGGKQQGTLQPAQHCAHQECLQYWACFLVGDQRGVLSVFWNGMAL